MRVKLSSRHSLVASLIRAEVGLFLTVLLMLLDTPESPHMITPELLKLTFDLQSVLKSTLHVLTDFPELFIPVITAVRALFTVKGESVILPLLCTTQAVVFGAMLALGWALNDVLAAPA